MPVDQLTEDEIMQRARDALQRALNTPPQPHAAKPKAKPPSLVKVRASKKRANAGKPAPSA